MQKSDAIPKALKEAAEAVADFLYRNGGLSNGYTTWVDTKTQTWRTPESRGLTHAQTDDGFNRLHSTLKTIAVKHKLAGSFECIASHIEDGCYRTEVAYTIRERVTLK